MNPPYPTFNPAFAALSPEEHQQQLQAAAAMAQRAALQQQQAAPSTDNFSETVERLLTTLEHRPNGKLTAPELSQLSMLCSLPTTSEDLGFADVDADMMGQLVQQLEKQVALVSNINLLQLTFGVFQKSKSGESKSVDHVRNTTLFTSYYNSIQGI